MPEQRQLLADCAKEPLLGTPGAWDLIVAPEELVKLEMRSRVFQVKGKKLQPSSPVSRAWM